MTSGTLLQAILLTATKWSLHPPMDRFANFGKTIIRLKGTKVSIFDSAPIPKKIL